ncbi:hypothetical protein [Tahibacter amnicola]|uniref:PQ loop repeat protein n=1 Tax=Tahibacter amnicola TaxID=2976241 RepID=A0ABY6BFC9_9GAMM|nr:hypothetical protein [Tahibacter amnicola]UXI67060.1 hypothetical protein N4264_20245 [Tahibacter amnicola]
MNAADLIGCTSTLILIITLGRQVVLHWRCPDRSRGARWLFFGQMAASIGFIIYSAMVDSTLFVVTNCLILLTAITGFVIALRKAEGA